MKKLLCLLIVLLILTGCGGTNEASTTNSSSDVQDNKEEVKEEAPKELTFNVPIVLGDFEVTFYDQYTATKVDNSFSDYNGLDVIRIPCKIKNLGQETQGINMFYLEFFGSKGKELDSVSYYFDDSLETSGDLRPGSENEGAIYLLYDGDGDYFVEYDDWSNKTEIKLPISMANVSEEKMVVEVGNSSSSSSGESGFNQTVKCGNFEITCSDDYSFTTVSNQFSENYGDEVVKIPVHIKNVGSETEGINMFYIKYFNSSGRETESICFYFDDSVERSGDLRPDAECDAYSYIIYDGDGEYCLQYDDFSNFVEIALPIVK